MPLCCLLVGISDFEDCFLGEGLADNLKADGKSVAEAGRDGDGRQAGDVYWDGADIREVHLEGVVYLLANLKGDGG